MTATSFIETALLKRSLRLSLLALIAAGLGGCSEPEVKDVELPPRAIKYIKLSQLAKNATRQLAGVVKPGTSANVAFEINGRVIEMTKNIGDAVKKGELLAKLDPKSIELEVQQAEFSLKQALATLEDTRSKLSQKEQLWKSRYTTKTALDTAKVNFANAEGQVGIARSQLDLKKRDLGKTALDAPFSGTVSERLVEVFEEVAAGAANYKLQTQGENEVEVSVPETLIGFVKVADAVVVKLSPLNGTSIKGLVTEVSPQAGDANAFPVTVRLEKSPPELRPGMSAQVIIAFKGEATGKAYSIPVGALKPDVEENQGTVFVYDSKTETVRQAAVKVVGIKGNNPEIVGDIKPGDIIAVAGVGQMYDGMKVRLLKPEKSF